MLGWLTSIALSVVALWLVAAWAVDRFGARSTPAATADALLVPGCRVLADGQPSPGLRRRVQRAVELYRRGVAPRLILTGGPPDRNPTEAAAAARLALSLGVPDGSLILEQQAASTEENARFTAQLTASPPHRIESLILVTDTYQILRAGRAFARHYPRVSASAVVSPFADRCRNSLREVPALVYYRLRHGI